MDVIKFIGKGLGWLVKNLFWKPLKWVATTVYKKVKGKPKDVLTENAVSATQKAASADLTKLRKQADKLEGEMRDFEKKWLEKFYEHQRVESVIYVGSGKCFEKKPPKVNNGNNNNNRNKNNKGNQNQQGQQNKNLPPIAESALKNHADAA